MKRASKRNPREFTRRLLKLETLERREVFAVGGLDPSFAYGFGNPVADFGGTADYSVEASAIRGNQSSLLDDLFAELGNETQARGGSNSNIANHPHQLSLRVSGSH